MANQTLQQIRTATPATPLAGTELVYILQGGADAGALASDFKTLAVGAGSVSVASGKTLTVSNTLTLAGTDGTTMTFPSTSQSIPGLALNNVFTRGQTITEGTANEAILASTGYSLTGSSAVSMIDLAGTWNTSGTPTAIKLNITDTASNAASVLMDLQVGAASKFSLSKGGNAALSGYLSSTASQLLLFGSSNGGVGLGASTLATGAMFVGNGGVPTAQLKSTAQFGWAPSSDPSAAVDLALWRDAANTLAQRNGTAAQTHNIYGTYTDASNYSAMQFQVTSSFAQILTAYAGTGAITDLYLGATNGAVILRTGSGSLTEKWRVAQAGHFLAGTDNTYDIGASSATRPRALYLAAGITTAGGAVFHTTSTALTDGAGAGGGTLLNAPAAGNPTKWIGINDNGTTRYIPAW